MTTIIRIFMALFLVSCTAGVVRAEPISDTDMSYVVEHIGTMFAIKSCGAKLIDGGLKKYAERTGVDFVKTYSAVVAAYRAMTDQPYNSENLIPAITVAVNKWATTFVAAKEANEAHICAMITKHLKEASLIE
jgi:hypothetical protein